MGSDSIVTPEQQAWVNSLIWVGQKITQAWLRDDCLTVAKEAIWRFRSRRPYLKGSAMKNYLTKCAIGEMKHSLRIINTIKCPVRETEQGKPRAKAIAIGVNPEDFVSDVNVEKEYFTRADTEALKVWIAATVGEQAQAIIELSLEGHTMAQISQIVGLKKKQCQSLYDSACDILRRNMSNAAH